MYHTMRKSILAISALSFMSITQAAYTIIIPMEQSKGGSLPNGSISITPRTPGLPAENWQPTEPLYGVWVNANDIYGCSNWTPATSTQPIGVIFQQTADDCKRDQTTTKQDREKETTTLAYRNVGQPTTATRTLAAQSSRQATGTQENWQPAEPAYSDWINTGNIYGCSNWTPAASTMLKDEAFNQTATDCKQDQIRTIQDREQETTTLAYRNVGAPVAMEQNVTVDSSRTATGTASCSYSRSVNRVPDTYWFAGTRSSSDAYLVKVNGVQIKAADGYYTTSFTLNGIRYKRGTILKDSTAGYNSYEVCK